MAKEYVEVFRTDQNNVGDMFSNPLRYFANKDDNIHTVDIDLANQTPYPDNVPVIVGGGGLIGNEYFGQVAGAIAKGQDFKNLENMWQNRWICKNASNEQIFNEFNEQFLKAYQKAESSIHQNQGPKVLWGAGHNMRDWSEKDEIKWPKWMSDFTLVGIRDYLQGYEWVPCASCMHPAFDKEYEVTNKVIWFEHKKQLIKATEFGREPVLRFCNSGQNFEQVIELLGSAETVVTNSYHGVYWATLLGKKVICVDAWSSKFFYFKHKPLFCKSKAWEERIGYAPSYPEALEECRTANVNFWNKVKQL